MASKLKEKKPEVLLQAVTKSIEQNNQASSIVYQVFFFNYFFKLFKKK